MDYCVTTLRLAGVFNNRALPEVIIAVEGALGTVSIGTYERLKPIADVD